MKNKAYIKSLFRERYLFIQLSQLTSFNNLGVQKFSIVYSIAMHTCNPGTWEAQIGGLRIQGQPVIHSKTMTQKTRLGRWLSV